jgi:hypothetical protein
MKLSPHKITLGYKKAKLFFIAISRLITQQIYPNPALQTILIQFNSLNKINSFSIFNILGQKEIQNNDKLKWLLITTYLSCLADSAKNENIFN